MGFAVLDSDGLDVALDTGLPRRGNPPVVLLFGALVPHILPHPSTGRDKPEGDALAPFSPCKSVATAARP